MNVNVPSTTISHTSFCATCASLTHVTLIIKVAVAPSAVYVKLSVAVAAAAKASASDVQI